MLPTKVFSFGGGRGRSVIGSGIASEVETTVTPWELCPTRLSSTTLIAAMRRLRPAVGVTPQEFVQRASIAAWGDERHVEENRRRYAAKRAIFLDLFARYGVRVAGSEGTFYLWVAVPDERPSLAWALELLDRADVVVAPGSFFGPEGEGYVRMAMVPTRAECERAARSLEAVLQGVRA